MSIVQYMPTFLLLHKMMATGLTLLSPCTMDLIWLVEAALPLLSRAGRRKPHLYLSGNKNFSEPLACVWSLPIYLSTTTSQIVFSGGGHLMKVCYLGKTKGVRCLLMYLRMVGLHDWAGSTRHPHEHI